MGDQSGPSRARWERIGRPFAIIGLVAVVLTSALADYVSSWLPSVGGFPAGAILRDAVASIFIGLAGAVMIRERLVSGRTFGTKADSLGVAPLAFLPFAALAAWVFVLVVPSPATVPALLAARNLVLYTLVGFAAYVLVTRRLLPSGVLLGTLTGFGFIAAALGILDTATHGEIVSSLGYRRDYSGVEGSAESLIAGASAAFQGYVRASGGISNALVFGYLMAAISVFATWMLDRSVDRSGWASRETIVSLALGTLAGVACIFSLTRGALIALVIGLVLLVIVHRGRPILVGAATTMVMAVALTWAGSGTADPIGQGGPVANPTGSAVPGQTAAAPASEDPSFLDIIGERVTSSDTSSQESSSLRVEQVRAGLKSLALRPMGNGLGTEGSASTRAGAARADLTPDVFALIVALQTGVVGAILYGLIFAAMLLWSVRGPAQGRALVLAMIGIFGIAGVLSASPDAPVFATTIWILILAVSAAPASEHHSPGSVAG